MKKHFILSAIIFLAICAQAQTFKVSAGPEVLKSINHDERFFGAGGSVQLDVWVREKLGLGINTGYLKFNQTSAPLAGFSKKQYSLIPILGVIRYPLPIVKGLYGQDLMGYTLAQDVQSEATGKKVAGGFTYYFALGYVFADHFDISVKVGRSRLDKKNDPANVNEHNLGLKLAYIF